MIDLVRVTCFFAACFALAAVAGGQNDSEAQAAPPANPPKPCTSPEYRQFDFWLGTWEVRGKDSPDRPPAKNVITAEHGGCMVHEQYTAGRYNGSSINFYNAQTKRWHQTWIDNQGAALFLSGGLDKKGRMVLESDPEKSPRQRITWTPKKNGSVRQYWQQSEDGGKTWSDVFDGTYTKAE